MDEGLSLFFALRVRGHNCWVCVIFFACVCVGASDMTTVFDDPSSGFVNFFLGDFSYF
jgi:hypothetical protein